MQQISANVYAETAFRGSNNGFVVTKEGVVMIDTPQMPVDAVKWRDEIAKHGRVIYLINTEPHGDHFTGNYFFKGTVVGHQGTRAAILSASVEQLKKRLEQTSPDSLPLLKRFRYRPPTITFSHELTLHAGDHTFRLIRLPGHTPFQTAVFIPEERVVFTSDNVTYKEGPWLQQPLPYEWLDSLKRLQELEADVLVPGHGEVCDHSFLPEMSNIIRAWIDAVTAAMKQGMSLEEAQDKLPIPESYRIDARLQRMNVAGLYQALKK